MLRSGSLRPGRRAAGQPGHSQGQLVQAPWLLEAHTGCHCRLKSNEFRSDLVSV